MSLSKQLARAKVRAGDDSMRRMVEALDDATDNLVAMARGLHVLHFIDVTGGYRQLGPAKAKDVAGQPDLVAASVASGQAKVFVLPPDLDAIKVLMDRVMGKVPTVMEIELKPQIEQTKADHAELAMVIREHVPDQYLGPVVATLERIARRRDREAAGVAG